LPTNIFIPKALNISVLKNLHNFFKLKISTYNANTGEGICRRIVQLCSNRTNPWKLLTAFKTTWAREKVFKSYWPDEILTKRCSSSICYREHLIMKTSTVEDSKFPTTSFQNKRNSTTSYLGYYILFSSSLFFLIIIPFWVLLLFIYLCPSSTAKKS
jgi:hypothetical protein